MLTINRNKMIRLAYRFFCAVQRNDPKYQIDAQKWLKYGGYEGDFDSWPSIEFWAEFWECYLVALNNELRSIRPKAFEYALRNRQGAILKQHNLNEEISSRKLGMFLHIRNIKRYYDISTSDAIQAYHGIPF